MLHILWMVIKVIGIIIGILAGLLLLALFLILFCPVRYRVSLKKGEEPVSQAQAAVGVSWLFRGVLLKLTFQNEKLDKEVRIFGIPVLKLLKKKRSIPDTAPEHEQAKEEKIKKPLSAEPAQVPVKPAQEPVKPAQATKVSEEKVPDRGEEAPKTRVWAGIWNRIRSFWGKLKAIPERVMRFFGRIRESVQRIVRMVSNARNRLDWWQQFFWHPKTQEALRLVKERAGRLIRHVMPTKIDGEVTFGSEDPSVTGTVLAVLGITIPFHKNRIAVSPVFEGVNVLEGNVRLKGRVYGFVLLKTALDIYFNKNVKFVLYHWKKRKEG